MSPERFIDLVRAEQESLRRFLLALCKGDSFEADDIAQDALVRAYVASGSFWGSPSSARGFSVLLITVIWIGRGSASRIQWQRTLFRRLMFPPRITRMLLSGTRSCTWLWISFRKGRRR